MVLAPAVFCSWPAARDAYCIDARSGNHVFREPRYHSLYVIPYFERIKRACANASLIRCDVSWSSLVNFHPSIHPFIEGLNQQGTSPRHTIFQRTYEYINLQLEKCQSRRDSDATLTGTTKERTVFYRYVGAWADRLFRLKAPFDARPSLLIPIKFNDVDQCSSRSDWLNYPRRGRCHEIHSNSSRADRYPRTCVRDQRVLNPRANGPRTLHRRWPSLIRVLCFLVINNVACQVGTEDATLICIQAVAPRYTLLAQASGICNTG